MRAIRVVCLIGVAVGVITMAFQPTEMPVVPFPGSGHTVVLLADIARSADYRLLVTIPTSGPASSDLDEERISCEFNVTLTGPGHAPYRRDIQTLYRFGRIGSMHLDEFSSDASWYLNRGSLSMEVSGTGSCNAIASRGGALSIKPEQTHTTEVYLLNQLMYWGGRGLVALGFLALALMEIRPATVRPKQP